MNRGKVLKVSISFSWMSVLETDFMMNPSPCSDAYGTGNSCPIGKPVDELAPGF